MFDVESPANWAYGKNFHLLPQISPGHRGRTLKGSGKYIFIHEGEVGRSRASALDVSQKARAPQKNSSGTVTMDGLSHLGATGREEVLGNASDVGHGMVQLVFTRGPPFF